jgi:hypothetical protein
MKRERRVGDRKGGERERHRETQTEGDIGHVQIPVLAS